ncbi:MAG TPA: efflux RND transporter periplasmic adaptor subunit [Candidatus Sulfotelmatobacter sp.]|jgi:HlyD family secretion protein|nr:efflux RND transporter periplasmic adaptor subunit [Candidatus Sulfotelmatobacter sp.]
MSTAPAEVTPESESLQEQPGSQPEPTPDHQGPRRWRVWVIAAVLLFALSLVLTLVFRSRTPLSTKQVPVTYQNPEYFLRLKGTTEAVQARAILAPLLAGQQIGTLTIIHIAQAGAKVKQGDLLVEFDRQAQMRDIIDKQAEYQKLVDQVAGEQAKESAARAKDETELKTAEDNLRKAELEIQKTEIVSRIDAEKNQENLEEAKATYDQLRETFDLKRKAAQAAIRILEIQRDRTQQTMEHAKANSDKMQIRSPLDGVVVLNTIWKQGTMGEVQEGDQVRAGVPFMQVVNPATMQVRVHANQQDFPSLQVGQMAKVRLDAYPEMVLEGKVDQISPIGENGDFSSKLRTFVVIVAIEGNDPKLMPDLSAAVDVDTTKHSAQSGMVGTGGGSI